MTDTLGDMIAMIKNANQRGRREVRCPHSRLREGVARVMHQEGYLSDVRVTEVEAKGTKRKFLHVTLKTDADGNRVLTDVVRVSKPGRRTYRPMGRLGKVMDGLGIWILSTSQGIMSDRSARTKRTGGEILCKVW
ncbi:MAG: 30S ribosomal protein S8 [Planctomycetes bacterium]|nr:30S ribosomal protein S8 [Planctomycetota bacterium]